MIAQADVLGRIWHRAMKMTKGLEHLADEKGCESWDSLSWRNEGSWGDLIKVQKYLKGRCKEDRVPLNVRKHFFSVRVSEHWRRLPRQLGESPCLQIFKSCLDMALGNWLQVALLEQGHCTR